MKEHGRGALPEVLSSNHFIMSKKDKIKRIFGTDGVRGRANVEPVTAEPSTLKTVTTTTVDQTTAVPTTPLEVETTTYEQTSSSQLAVTSVEPTTEASVSSFEATFHSEGLNFTQDLADPSSQAYQKLESEMLNTV